MEVAMAVAVTGALVSTLSKLASEKLYSLIERKYEKWKSVEKDILFIKSELRMILSTVEPRLSREMPPNSMEAMNTLRDLAYNIEDCLDQFQLCCDCEGYDNVSFLSKFPAEIQSLINETLRIREQTKFYADMSQPMASGSAANKATSRAPLAKPVLTLGIMKAKNELRNILVDHVEGEQEQMRAICIVGFGGSGKTRLAREVYDSFQDGHTFPTRAWVDAWMYKDDYKGLLIDLLKRLPKLEDRITGDSDVEQLRTEISNYLNTNRSLVVFDDIDEQQWDDYILPEETRSRIIVTTTSQAAANNCRSDGGYIYNMKTLDENDSKALLKAMFKKRPTYFDREVATPIVGKCDGHPLALVSVAKYLKMGNDLRENCTKVCGSLGSQMEEQSAFQELRRVLMSSYGNLSDHGKTCLLYMSGFPKGFQIRRSSLIRRWVAQGYVQSVPKQSDEAVAHDNFNQLIERNIIEPMHIGDDAIVNTCRTYAVMRELMLHTSFCDRFIGSLDAGQSEPTNFRHLFIQNDKNNRINWSGRKEDRARSLTIFGSGKDSISYITKLELLQVLDLMECTDFSDNLLKDIMNKLRRLKYLSLGSATKKVPKTIKELHCLHTLELNKTNVVALPIEVIKLPHLVHLFGKVKLRKKKSINALQAIYDIISKKETIGQKSKLQTLSGFIIDEDSIIPELMVHMRGLRKVKIWCDSTGESNTDWIIHLKEAIENMVMYEMDTGVGVRSLSLYLGNALENLLGRLGETNGFLTTLKLHGRLSQFPKFVTSLAGIKELCLSSTNLTGSDLSGSGLGELPCLLYLKLVEYNLVGFVIKKGDYPVLQRLCLVVESPTPVLPTIEEEALPELVSLHLLCGHLVNLAGINIRNHTNLQEVALDSAISMETIITWEDEARKHPKRPKVLFFKRVGTPNTGCTVKYTATERPKTPESTGTDESMDIDTPLRL
ncbi:disease resistance protein RGA4-like [Oryza sativa Japonica Group]|uniref:disease resistance protein RGA4-like n=1 Tax=Oryza sativa subsp. japonica TaxID=39947 RepID=UPI00339C523B